MFIYKTQSYDGKLPRQSKPWRMKTLNHLQVQTAITPLDLGTGRNRKLLFTVFVILSDFYSHLSGIRHSSDPLVHHGCHFRRTVYAMCNVRSLITNGLCQQMVVRFWKSHSLLSIGMPLKLSSCKEEDMM